MQDEMSKDATLRMSKCVALLKDHLRKMRTGRANTGLLDGIKVDYYGSEVPLSQVATKTGGQYFQASDTGSLLQIYRQIDRMEKRKVDDRRYTLFDELFLWFIMPGCALLLFEMIAGSTFWLRVP